MRKLCFRETSNLSTEDSRPENSRARPSPATSPACSLLLHSSECTRSSRPLLCSQWHFSGAQTGSRRAWLLPNSLQPGLWPWLIMLLLHIFFLLLQQTQLSCFGLFQFGFPQPETLYPQVTTGSCTDFRKSAQTSPPSSTFLDHPPRSPPHPYLNTLFPSYNL